MSEVYRVLKGGGLLLSFTPAFPYAAAWRDPTHVNIITDETFSAYLCGPELLAKMYGFKGEFEFLQQSWHDDQLHLITILKKT